MKNIENLTNHWKERTLKMHDELEAADILNVGNYCLHLFPFRPRILSIPIDR